MNSLFVDIHTHKMAHGALTLTSYGVHPHHASPLQEPLDEALFAEVDAVGEIGIDRLSDAPLSAQQQLFEYQLDIAQRLGKIVVIHCVRAYGEVISTLAKYKLRCVIFHGFIGSVQLAEELLRRGYYISFGVRTLSSPKTMEALRHMPLDRLFVESDVSDESIEQIYNMLSDVISLDVERLREVVYNNYRGVI